MQNTKQTGQSDFSLAISKYSPFVKEAKKRFLYTCYIFLGATLIGFIFYEPIIKFILDLISLRGVNIVFTSPFQFINLAISCGLATGLVVVFPYIVVQILWFIRPALRKTEYKSVTRYIPFSVILFLFGFAFGVFIMKWQIEIFLDRSESLGIENILDISKFLSTVVTTSALMGIGFQFPIILLLLLRLGIVDHNSLSKRRKWIYASALIFAILLPADSILADIVLSLPLILMFEASLMFHRMHLLRSKKLKPNNT